MLRANKKSQGGIFGLSFGMIVSIILIVFFITSAFMGIRTFLNWQKCANLGMFIDDLQVNVNTAWNAEYLQANFTSALPSGVHSICFVNLTDQALNANTEEKAIFDLIQEGAISDYKANLFIYAPNKDYCLKWATIKNVDLSQKNPICIKTFSGKVKIQITRDYTSPLVKVSY